MAVLRHHAPGDLVITGLEVIRESNAELLALNGQLTCGDILAVDDDLDLGADFLDVAGEVHLEPLGLLIEFGTVLGIRRHQLIVRTGCRGESEHAHRGHQQGGEAQPESGPVLSCHETSHESFSFEAYLRFRSCQQASAY